MSHKMGKIGLGPVSVRSCKLFGPGPNNFLKTVKCRKKILHHSCIIPAIPHSSFVPLAPSSSQQRSFSFRVSLEDMAMKHNIIGFPCCTPPSNNRRLVSHKATGRPLPVRENDRQVTETRRRRENCAMFMPSTALGHPASGPHCFLFLENQRTGNCAYLHGYV